MHKENSKILEFSPLLIYFSAIFLGISTVNYMDNTNYVDFFRHFSEIITICELVFIFLLIHQGISFSNIFMLLPVFDRICLLSLSVIMIITAMSSTVDFFSGILRTFNWFVHFIFALSVADLWRRSDLSKAVFRHNDGVFNGLLAWLLSLVIFVNSIENKSTFSWIDFYYTVGNVRQIGFFGTVGVCLGIGLSLNERKFWRLLFRVFGSSLFVVAIYWAGVRSSIAGVGIAIIVGGWAYPALFTARGIAVVIGPFVIAAPIAIMLGSPHPLMGFWRLFHQAPAEGASSFTTGRWDIWRGTLRMIWERPLFGYGESQYKLLVPENHGHLLHPHNVELQIAFSWGLVGATLFFYLLGKAGTACFKAARADPQRNLPAFLAVLGLFGFAQVEGSMYHTWPTMMMVFLAAAILGEDAGRRTQRCEVAQQP